MVRFTTLKYLCRWLIAMLVTVCYLIVRWMWLIFVMNTRSSHSWSFYCSVKQLKSHVYRNLLSLENLCFYIALLLFWNHALRFLSNPALLHMDRSPNTKASRWSKYSCCFLKLPQEFPVGVRALSASLLWEGWLLWLRELQAVLFFPLVAEDRAPAGLAMGEPQQDQPRLWELLSSWTSALRPPPDSELPAFWGHSSTNCFYGVADDTKVSIFYFGVTFPLGVVLYHT